MIRRLLLLLILVGVTYGQFTPIMSCEGARAALVNTCGTTWTSVRSKIIGRMAITANEATTLCDDLCAHTVLQVLYRCASEDGVSLNLYYSS